jgi:hypothetical protein
MHDRAGFLDDDLGGEGLRAVFAIPSNYRTHVAPISMLSYEGRSVQPVGPIAESV